MSRATPLEIAFFGLPIAALLLHRDGIRFRYCGLSRKEAIGARRLRRVLGDVPIEVLPDLNDEKASARIRSYGGELLVSWYWVKNIPSSVRDAYPLGTLGIHPSLLPRHRGPDPFFWAVDCGDVETGVTGHRLANEYDTGAIVGRKTLPIDPTWTAWRLAKKLDRPSLALLRETVGAVARGEALIESPQDDARATPAPAPTEEELEIDWTQSTATVERRVRAAAPWPGAYMFLGDEALTLTRVRIASEVVRALMPGEAWVGTDADGQRVARVRTADGAIELLSARVEANEDSEGGDLDQLELADAMENDGRLA